MQRLFRLLRIIYILAKYRLVTLLPNHPALIPLRLFFVLLPPFWFGSRANEGERLRLALQELGPIFIKLGQLLATRKDLLDDTITDALSKLHDQVPEFGGLTAKSIIEGSLNGTIEQNFSRFDIKPLASASIAQVHSAALLSGQEVVIKVVRPEIKNTIKLDISLMYTAAYWVERFVEDSDLFQPSNIVADYEKIILAELDLEKEAQNSITMRNFFEFSPLLYIPKIHTEYTRKNIMVMDRMYGIPADETDRIIDAGVDLKKLAQRGVEIFFTQVFRDNFFHADMHPGNIFVSPEHPELPQYIAIDCAIVGQLSKADQMLLARLVLAVIQQDIERLVDIIMEAGWVSRDVDRYHFTQEISTLVESVFNKPLAEIDFAPMVLSLFAMARNYRMRIPSQYMLLIKTLVHIEGMGQRLDPHLDIWSIGRPLLEQWMLEQVGPSAILKKLQSRAPEWLAQLPDMPQLLHDSLLETRQSNAQRQTEQRVNQLSYKALRRDIKLATLSLAALAGAMYFSLHPAEGSFSCINELLAGISGFGLLSLVLRR